MSIVPLNIGSASNDGNGQNLRSGGQVINANFAELDQRTTAAQSAADAAQAKADTAQAKADAAIPSLQKGQPNGVAGLDGSGTVPASQLPSYVDDVLEFGSFAALPAAGETGKIYITTDTNSQYRWSGTQYVLLTASPGSTDAVPEGAVNKYWTLARTLGSALAGLVTTSPAVIAATDTVLAAFGKLQRQITDLTTSVANKASNGANSDITSLTGLTTPLSIVQGGTGNNNGKATDSDKLNGQPATFYTAIAQGATNSAAGVKGLVPAPSVLGTNPKFLSDDMTYREAVSRDKILGAVLPLSAGIPQGAIIERGSNTNGEYIKFADGTLICTYSVASLAISAAVGATVSSALFQFPAAFAGRWVPTYTGHVTDAAVSLYSIGMFDYASAANQVGWRFTIRNTGGTAITQILGASFTAIGRWF